MKVICAWCGGHIEDKDGEGVEGDSHGVCKACLARLLAETENEHRSAD